MNELGAMHLSKILCAKMKLLASQPGASSLAATDQELKALEDKLTNGLQTEDQDHRIIADLLECKVIVHQDQVCESIGSSEAPKRIVHVRFLQRVDGAGAAQGHFDVLLPTEQFAEESSSDDAEKPDSVTHALTVRGREIAWGLLSGKKDIENRSFGLADTWVALHVGRSEATQSLKNELWHLIPDMGPHVNFMTRGCVVGLIYISQSWSLADYRQQVQCGASCTFNPNDVPSHAADCKCSPFALGPVLNFVKHIIMFKEHLPCKGKLGKWPLGSDTLAKIRNILQTGAYKQISNAHDYPMAWPLQWLSPDIGRCPQEIAFCSTLLIHYNLVFIYFHIYIYMHIYIYIYVYIFIFIYTLVYMHENSIYICVLQAHYAAVEPYSCVSYIHS